MNVKTIAILAALMPLASQLPTPAFAQAPAPAATPAASQRMSMIDFGAADTIERIAVSPGAEGQVAFERATAADSSSPGLLVTIEPGKSTYPGFEYTPKTPINISAYGHVEVRICNTGAVPINPALRLDNKEDAGGPAGTNTESTSIKPGAIGTIVLYPGYGYGKKPSFKLRTNSIAKLLIFTTKSSSQQSFRIDSIVATGTAGEPVPVDPGSVRIKLKDNVIFGPGTTVDAAKQIEAKSPVEAGLDNGAIKVSFAASKLGQAMIFKPVLGRWDLRQALQVHVKVKNTGSTPISPRVQILSNGGPTEAAIPAAPIAPGAKGEIVASFIPSTPWLGIKDSVKTEWNGQPDTGTKFTSDAVSGIKVFAKADDPAQSFVIESIQGGLPAPSVLPDWVGKRPPVEGEWTKTFDEEFDGNTLDMTKWNIYADNFWDKRSHFSKDNVILGGGVVRLRYEKKTGFHNDDPSKKQTDYATGFLDTYGKWVQRYGYFECRMKATKGPGMWPAFWLMPDRGVQAGPQWKRANTGNEGMEFDIWEYLGRWGQYRYNIAMHWDGYGKEHKQTGCTTNYVMPDKEGFITIGLLWTPGVAVYYANGKEVLRWESPRISSVESDIMFTNVTGGWDNDGIDDTQMPDDYVLDYVRCWQRKDLASPVDGFKTPALSPAQ